MSASDVSLFHLLPRVSPSLCRLPLSLWCGVSVWFVFLLPRCSFVSGRVVLQVSSFIQL